MKILTITEDDNGEMKIEGTGFSRLELIGVGRMLMAQAVTEMLGNTKMAPTPSDSSTPPPAPSSHTPSPA